MIRTPHYKLDFADTVGRLTGLDMERSTANSNYDPVVCHKSPNVHR